MVDEQLKLLKQHFQECEFKATGEDDCECEKAKKGERIWFESTSYECSDEGDYYCDKCGIDEINSREEFCKNFVSEYESGHKTVTR